jgi:MATE family multidrug resistance protein
MSAQTLSTQSSPDLRQRVFRLAWPVITENFLQTMLGIVDTLLVARLGAEALAGVGAAIQIMFFVISALSATSVGASVLVAQAVGGHALADASRYAKQALVWSAILSVPMVIIGLVAAEPLIAAFGMEPEVTQIGADYLRVTMGTVVVLSLMFLSSGVMRGAGDSRTPMLVVAFINVINVFLTYGLIFGAFGLPELGAVGSAWATFIARAIGFVILVIILHRGVEGVSIRGRDDWRPQIPMARRILGIGIPAGVEQMIISTGFLAMTIFVARISTLALAAHRIAFNALSVSFLPGIGFGVAATALVGQAIGAQRLQEGNTVSRIATRWAMAWMSALGIIFFLFAEQIMRFFTDDPIVIELGAAGLRPLALTQPFWAILFVQSGSLRGTGDTRFPLRVNTIGIWVAVLLGGALALTLGGGLATVWSAFLLTAPVSAFLLWRRFQRTIHEEHIDAVY